MGLTTEAGIEPVKHEMAVMDGTGDTKIAWDPTKADEVATAKKTFDDLRKKGYAAFKVNKRDGSNGEQIREFDPNAEAMILAPPMAGG